MPTEISVNKDATGPDVTITTTDSTGEEFDYYFDSRPSAEFRAVLSPHDPEELTGTVRKAAAEAGFVMVE